MVLNNSFKWVMVLTLLAMIVLSGCTSSVSEPAVAQEPPAANELTQAELEAEIAELVWAFEDAYEAGDLDTVMSFYADNVVSLPPGFPKTVGKADVEAGFKELFDAFTIERDFDLVSVDVSGDMATRLGEWTQTLTPKDGREPIVEVGRCILGFKRVDDEWKVAWEIWNTESVTGGEPEVVEASSAEEEAEIAELVWAFEDAYEAGDLDAVMGFYADDVVSLPPGFPKTVGKADVEAGFKELFDAFTIERDFDLVSVDVSGNTATRLGEWTQTLTPKDGGEPIVETGRCILGFEKSDTDEWEVTWEIWNTY